MTHRRQSRLLIVSGIFAGGAVALWLAGSIDPAPQRSPIPGADAAIGVSANLPAVRSAVVRSESWPATLDAFGNIAPRDELIVSARIGGQPVIELHANVGERVRKGQLLARFDAELPRIEARRLRAEVEQAVAEVGQTLVERDRAVQLGDSGGISAQEVLQRVTAAQVATARLDVARAQLAAREFELRHADVIAPDDGTISARRAQTGLIGTSGMELFRIIRRDQLEWRGELTAAQIARVTVGQQVLLSLADDASGRAQIRELAPALNPQTRQAVVYADIEPDGRAAAGMYVGGRIELSESLAVVVPMSSIVVRDGYSFVFIVTADSGASHVRQQRVEIGRRQGTNAEIISGLAAGARVVTAGAGFLDDDDSVRIVTNDAEPARDAVQ